MGDLNRREELAAVRKKVEKQAEKEKQKGKERREERHTRESKDTRKTRIAPAPSTAQSPFIDAKGQVEQEIGRQASQITTTAPVKSTDLGIVGKVIQAEENLSSRISRPLWERRTQALREAEEAKRQGRDLEAGLKYSEGQAYRAAHDVYQGASFIIRPGAWVGTVRGAYQLATKQEARRQWWVGVKRDPLGAIVSLPASYLGGHVASKTIGYTGTKVKEIRMARKAASYSPEEMLVAETEMGLQYPEPTQVQRTTARGFEEMKDAGTVDTTSHAKFDTLPNGMKPVSTDFMPYQPPKGKWASGSYDKKLWRSTGEGLEEIYWAPPETPLMPVYKPIMDIELAHSYAPGVRYTGVTPRLKPWTTQIGYTGLFSLAKPQQLNVTKPSVSDYVSPAYRPKIGILPRRKEITKVAPEIKPKTTPVPIGGLDLSVYVKPVHVQKETVKSVQKVESLPKQITKQTPEQIQKQISRHAPPTNIIAAQRTRPTRIPLMITPPKRRRVNLLPPLIWLETGEEREYKIKDWREMLRRVT